MTELDISILNEKQIEAVTSTDGPLLILAGAGSGKTRVLTYRIAFILQQGLAKQEEILAVTFTNKAAKEMVERIESLLGEKHTNSGWRANNRWWGTFHAFGVKLLRNDGHFVGVTPQFSIYDPSDQLSVVKEAMEELNISTKEINPTLVHNYISMAKNELISERDYPKYAKGYLQELVALIYPKYQEILRKSNAVDFDDLLLKTVQLFQGYEQVLQKYQQMFKYILVDEYQDTNHAQYVMINLLAKYRRNICVVGDDDQSIYAFRGATIRNILNFERDYPDAKIVKLEQNYRSTKTILEAAHAVVSKNTKRSPKKLWTENDDGAHISMYLARDEQDEANWVAKKIQDLSNNGTGLDDIAVLYRTNAQSRSLEEGFIRHVVNYRIIGGVRFYERKEIKDLLAYLKLMYNPSDDASFRRVVNVPRRGIGAKTLEGISQSASGSNLSMLEFLLQNITEINNRGLKDFAFLMKSIIDQQEQLNIVDLINLILSSTKYVEMLEDGTSENESRIENIKELLTVASKYIEYPPMESIELFLQEVSLLEDNGRTSQLGADTGGAVTLMTIHAAKGLEFKHVFVVGMEEGLFPHARVFTDPSELEEERRLAYVAITRARENLYMVHTESRLYFGSRQNNPPSRFIEEIPQKLTDRIGTSDFDRSTGWEVADDGWQQPAINVEVGGRVKHEYFGVGKVTNISSSTITIDFGPVYGRKELSKEFAPLVKI